MAQIRLLDESIAQKIAAGEVVERPASVIKELVENCIDAGSTFITVEIKEGGIEHIRVTDNGCGIPTEEVELAFLRHATSKIQSLQDLYNIQQMGFRGEALYSIAAVSKLELTTKPTQQPTGSRLIIHGGVKVSLGDYGCPDGTTIVANNLFYNTPARLKFLNKPGIEAGTVGTAVMRHILANPGISIKFISNEKVVYHSAGDGNLKNAIYIIFGKEVAKGLISVEEQCGDVEITGYLFAPGDAHGNRSHQMLMVNHRPVNNFPISGIIERVYAGLTDAKRFPGYVLNISLPPSEVDVNVHPNKLQVRFANEVQIKQAMESAVSKAMDMIKGQPLLWSFPQQAPDDSNDEERKAGTTEAPETQTAIKEALPELASVKIPDKAAFEPQPPLEFENNRKPVAVPVETISETVGRYTESVRSTLGLGSAGLPAASMTLMQRPSIANTAIVPQEVEQTTFTKKNLVRTIGQVFDTYALLEVEDKLLIVDQHAAHERLLYDKFMERLRNAESCSQKLLIPQVINISFEVKTVIDANLTLLESIGFDLEEYGRLSYQIRAVPFILGQPQVQDFIFELVDILSDDRALRTDELKKERVMSMACKKAVKGGDRLTNNELAMLSDIIAAEDTALTCPHGRPFVIILDRHSMEKQFRRVK
jgi:DNA mismatch repair protein MutL